MLNAIPFYQRKMKKKNKNISHQRRTRTTWPPSHASQPNPTKPNQTKQTHSVVITCHHPIIISEQTIFVSCFFLFHWNQLKYVYRDLGLCAWARITKRLNRYLSHMRFFSGAIQMYQNVLQKVCDGLIVHCGMLWKVWATPKQLKTLLCTIQTYSCSWLKRFNAEWRNYDC